MRILPLTNAMEQHSYNICLQTLILSFQDQEESNLEKGLILLQKLNPLNEIKYYLCLYVLATDALNKDKPLKGWRCVTTHMGQELIALELL